MALSTPFARMPDLRRTWNGCSQWSVRNRDAWTCWLSTPVSPSFRRSERLHRLTSTKRLDLTSGLSFLRPETNRSHAEQRNGCADWFDRRDDRHEGYGVYGASKAAVRALARTWANELAPRNIRVNVVSPGQVDTATFDAVTDEVRRLNSFIPLGRLGRFEEGRGRRPVSRKRRKQLHHRRGTLHRRRHGSGMKSKTNDLRSHPCIQRRSLRGSGDASPFLDLAVNNELKPQKLLEPPQLGWTPY